MSPAAVHPHARGEHICSKARSRHNSGSSPRSWGTLQFYTRRTWTGRFIPTLVGNTVRGLRRPARGPVHPHARGEHAPTFIPAILDCGSSPRSWGTRPAPLRVDCLKTVHPHARGEHLRSCPGCFDRCGSSPRSWGTRKPPVPASIKYRFIPTLVGNTSLAGDRARLPTVHPHARGEHGCPRCQRGIRRGSSPRSWGTLQLGLSHFRMRRFIPTLVGNTLALRGLVIAIAVHPHARGEHLCVVQNHERSYGSSPRSWGTLGDTFMATNKQTVHPHARGEHTACRPIKASAFGSSPRSWGTHNCGERVDANIRFIPTLVGNTDSTPAVGTSYTVHPHARGEHSIPPRVAPWSLGSSPRSWGTRG